MFESKKGFTLIELLIVIAIIGMLATISIVSLNTARARSRDAKRVADVKQIQTALEMYFNDVGSYPSGTTATATAITNGTTVYLSPYPAYPASADGACTLATNYGYFYTRTSATSYTINYCLGSATGGIPAGVSTATPSSIR